MSSTISSSYSYLQTANGRINGMASGMDTESIVQNLMKSASAPMELLQQQKQKYEWQRDAYRDVNTQLSTFSTTLFDQYGLQGSFPSKIANVSDLSKVSATATSSATGNLSLDSVTQLATAAHKEVTLSGASNTSTLGSLKDANGNSLGITSGTVTLSVLQTDGTTKNTTVTYNASDTLDTFMSKLNNSGVGISATDLFSNVNGNGTISITANATGNNVISANNDTGGVFQALGFLNSGTNSGTIANNGVNAQYTVNGLSMTSASNTVNISGYKVTLQQTFNTAVTISSTTDVNSMVDKIKAFVKTYNDLITSLQGKVEEAKYKDYAPLTDAQKAGMTQDQITKWEEKAKSGILRSDSNVRNALSNLRSIVYNTVDSVSTSYNSLYKIGVTTTDVAQNGGLLVIDEDKLRKALTNDSVSVMKLFTKDDTPTTTVQNAKINANQDADPTTGTGVIAQMRKAAKDAVSSIEQTSGKTTSVDNTYTLGKQLIDINKRITDWKSRLVDIENRYWNQFTAMENAIQKANSQTSMFKG